MERVLELYAHKSNLLQIRNKVRKAVGYERGSNLDLAVWEMIKNVEHRVKKTKAYVSVYVNGREIIVTTRNQVSPQEIQECINNQCLSPDDQLYLTHLRGEDIIRGLVGENDEGKGNYERGISPFANPATPEMICKIHIPTNKNQKAGVH